MKAFTMGERLALLRQLNKKMQKEVADKIGISDKTLSKWETNETQPSLLDITKLAEYYNVSVDFLANGKLVGEEDKWKDKKIKKLHKTNEYSDELSELLKPYGRFTTEEKSKIFRISEKGIMTSLKDIIERGDFDLFMLLSQKYPMYEVYENLGTGSYLDNVKKDVVHAVPYKLSFKHAIFTDKVEFYKEALKNLQEEKIKQEKADELYRKIGYNVPLRIENIDIEKELSMALEDVIKMHPNADNVLKYLLENGAWIMEKNDTGYYNGKDIILTNVLKKQLNCK